MIMILDINDFIRVFPKYEEEFNTELMPLENIINLPVFNIDTTRYCLYIHRGGSLIGFCRLKILPRTIIERRDCMTIEDLFIFSRWRNQGYCKKFLRKIIRHLPDLNIGCIILSVLQDNLSAIKCYSANGFSQVNDSLNDRMNEYWAPYLYGDMFHLGFGLDES